MSRRDPRDAVPSRRRTPKDESVKTLLWRMAREMARLREAEFTRCTHCGQAIIWANRPDVDTGEPTLAWHPPLEFVEFGYTVVNGAVFTVPTYRKHVCDPKTMRAYETEKAKLAKDRSDAQRARNAELKQAYDSRREETERVRLLDLDAVREVECERCGAAAGAQCEDLRLRKKGEVRNTRWAHPARVKSFLALHPERALLDEPPPGAAESSTTAEQQRSIDEAADWRKQLRQLDDAIVREVGCGRCGVAASSRCKDLTFRADRRIRRTNWVHDERKKWFLALHPERALPDEPPPSAKESSASTDSGSDAQ